MKWSGGDWMERTALEYVCTSFGQAALVSRHQSGSASAGAGRRVCGEGREDLLKEAGDRGRPEQENEGDDDEDSVSRSG